MSFKQTLPMLFVVCAACGAEDATPGASVSTAGTGNGSSSAGTGNGPSGVSGTSNSVAGSATTAAGSGAGGAPQAGSSSETAGTASSGAAGTGVGGSFVAGGSGGGPALPALDCGANGVAIENAGPTKNRVNYVILGDGYDATTVGTDFLTHIATYMKKRFSDPYGQPYGRYRKFVNICALEVVSQTNGIGNGPTPFSCTGDDQSRLANCNTQAAETELDKLPDTFEVDWHSIVLNNAAWWNTGSQWMLWSGANKDAAGAALHEGGHGFHQFADEYNGTSGDCGEFNEVNSTADQVNTNGKWKLWMGYDAADATGMQGVFQGSRYCPDSAAQFRPSDNSMMNSLFGTDKNTSFNAVSREKIVMDIWRIVKPVDSSEPPEGAVSNPTTLTVNVIDPAVINVDWSVDGNAVAKNGGPVYDIAAAKLASGMHTVVAQAYDNAPDSLVRATTGTCPDKQHCWNRDAWKNSQQTVTWTVTVP